MTLIEPVGIPGDICICGHWREDHMPQCIVIEEDGLDCLCTCFTPDDDDDWGYWFTDDEGHKIEGGVCHEINISNPLGSDKYSLSRAEFLCKDCQEGRHGCAGILEGFGLYISCSCSCADSSTDISAKKILKEMRTC